MGDGRSSRDVFAIREARALIGAGAASRMGEWLFSAALLGYVYSTTGSAGWVGAAVVGRLLPYLLVWPAGAALANRYPPRTLLLVSDALRLSFSISLAALVAADGPVVAVIAVTALTSAAGSPERRAGQELLPRVVGESRLGAASALLRRAQDLGVAVGPAIAALLLAVTPDFVAFLATGATFALSALLISSVRQGVPPAAAPLGAWTQGAQGLREIVGTRFAVPLFLVVTAAELAYGAQAVQLAVFAGNPLDLGSAGYGVLLTALGVGVLTSAVASGRLASTTRVARVAIAGAALASATQFVYAGFDALAICLIAAVLSGAGFVACEIVVQAVLGRIVPPEALGRVVGVHDTSAVLAMVTGALLAPILIGSTSLRTSFVVLGAAGVLVALFASFPLRGLDAVSAHRAEALASRLAVMERISVTAGVSQTVLERLATAAQTCPLPPGVDVVVEGAPAHAFYAVVDGRVTVHRNGTRVVHLGPGDSFGERGLLDSAPRNATVTTEVDTTLLRVEGYALLEALQAAPTLRPALEMSSSSSGAQVPDGESPLVDDGDWVGA